MTSNFAVTMTNALYRALCTVALAAVATAPLHAQAGQDSTATASVKLRDGSALQGRVVAETADSVTVVSETLGRLTFARSAITSISSNAAEAQSALAAVPTLEHSRPRRAKWSRKFEIGVQHQSEVVRDDAGAMTGISVGANLGRSTPKSTVKIGLQINYQRQDPHPAASDERLLTLTAVRDLNATYRLIAQTFGERNVPQEIDFRFTQHLGIGRSLVNSKRARLFVAPGVTYSNANASEEAELAANGTVTAVGFGVGFYESLSLQITPTIGLSQNTLWTEISGRRLRASTVTLSGQISSGVLLNAVYNLRYDSDLVDPVRKTFGKLMIGLQISR